MLPLLFMNKGNVYKNKILSLGPIGYWPLNEASGSTAVNHGTLGVAANAAYTDVTLGQPGIGDGQTSAYFNGTTSVLSMSSVSLAAALHEKGEISFLIWAKIAEAEWLDTNYTYLWWGADYSGYWLAASKRTEIYTLRLLTSDVIKFKTDWMLLGVTCSVSGNKYRAYIDGVEIGNIAGPAAAFDVLWDFFFSNPGGGYTAFKGYAAHAMLFDRVLTPTEILSLARRNKPTKIVSIIGHSIPAFATYGYPIRLADKYNNGQVTLINHAASGHQIMVDLAGDVIAAAGDNADVIIIDMGLNDNPAGDMEALQAEVEEAIVALKVSNTHASIYYLNCLPAFDGGGTPYDISTIRAAIAAACTAQSITCWDTFTDPWIAFIDTSDGWHLPVGGHAKVEAEIMAILP
jgi:hypothetical protein